MSSDLLRLIQAMRGVSSESWHQVHWTPPVDVYRTRQGWLLKFDLAGVRPGDIQLTVSGKGLTVRGRRRDWVVEESGPCSAYLMEITYSPFERTVELPCELEPMHIATDYRDGMLLVHLDAEGCAE